MRHRIGLGCIGLLLVALVAAASSGATSPSPAGKQVSALKHVGLSWVTYVVRGNAPKACRLQVETSVDGTPCDQLPTYFETLYCPEVDPDGHDPRWRVSAQLVGKTEVKGSRGTVIYRAASKKSPLTAKASFSRVGGKWRIASLQAGGQRLSPAGLIFTDGEKQRKKLWPAHC